MALVQRSAKAEILCQGDPSEAFEAFDLARPKRRNCLGTPEVMKQRRLLQATKLLAEVIELVATVRASSKALGKHTQTTTRSCFAKQTGYQKELGQHNEDAALKDLQLQ